MICDTDSGTHPLYNERLFGNVKLTLRMGRTTSDDQMPRYAILSHVWGREEVTFADIHDLIKAHRNR